MHCLFSCNLRVKMLTNGKMHLVTKNDRLKICIIFVQDVQVSWLNCHLHRVDLVETWLESTDCVLQSGSSVVFGWFSNKIVFLFLFQNSSKYTRCLLSQRIWYESQIVTLIETILISLSQPIILKCFPNVWMKRIMCIFFIMLFIGSKTVDCNPILSSCAWWI